MRWVLLCAVLFPAPIAADIFARNDVFEARRAQVDPQPIHRCIATHAADFRSDFVLNARRDCVGAGAKKCLADSDATGEGVFDRPTYLGCISLEKEYWEWRLDRVVAALSGEHGDQRSNFFSTSVPELNATVSIWSAFRDVRCRYQSRQYGVGPSRGREGDIVTRACEMGQTATFALDLEHRLRSHCAVQIGVNYGAACEFDE